MHEGSDFIMIILFLDIKKDSLDSFQAVEKAALASKATVWAHGYPGLTIPKSDAISNLIIQLVQG